MSSENDDVEMCETPSDIRDAATTVADNLLPEKSRKQYEKSYKDFMDWKTVKKATSFSEYVLLVYFQEISTKFKPCTLWTIYSMLKSTLNIKHEVDISKYCKLIAFLKRKSEGYTGKKSKTFLPEEIKKFLNEAPDKLYLMQKDDDSHIEQPQDLEHFELPESDLKFNWASEQDGLRIPALRYRNETKPTTIYKDERNISKKVEDEFDYWGKVMAAELRKMDTTQQIFAKKAITDILLEGQLGLLKKNSVQINKAPDPNGSEI